MFVCVYDVFELLSQLRSVGLKLLLMDVAVVIVEKSLVLFPPE